MNWKTENTCWTLMKRWLQKCRQMFWSIIFSGLYLWSFNVLHSKFTLKVTFLSRTSFNYCEILDLYWKFRSSFVAPFEISGALLLGLTRFWSTVRRKLLKTGWAKLDFSSFWQVNKYDLFKNWVGKCPPCPPSSAAPQVIHCTTL